MDKDVSEAQHLNHTKILSSHFLDITNFGILMLYVRKIDGTAMPKHVEVIVIMNCVLWFVFHYILYTVGQCTEFSFLQFRLFYYFFLNFAEGEHLEDLCRSWAVMIMWVLKSVVICALLLFDSKVCVSNK